jgi:hypothetical protein
MRVLIAALVVVVACTGAAFAQKSVESGNPAPQAGYASEPSAAAPADYHDEWRRNFMDGCTEGLTGMEPRLCTCALGGIERRVPFAESDAFDRERAAGRPGDPNTADVYRAIVVACFAASDA